MKYLFLISFIYPLVLLGQNEQIDTYWKLRSRYLDKHDYDSIVFISQRIIELDPKIAKENNIDYYLADAAFQTKNYEVAIKHAKKFIPTVYIKARTAKRGIKNRRCQDLYFQLANYYEQKEDYQKAYHSLSLIHRKYNQVFCCTCRHSWKTNLYNRMIDCSTKLGKTGRVKRLEKKLEKLNNDSANKY